MRARWMLRMSKELRTRMLQRSFDMTTACKGFGFWGPAFENIKIFGFWGWYVI